MELHGHLPQLRSVAADLAKDLRERALAVDADPADMTSHLGSPAIELIRRLYVPLPLNPEPIRIGGHTLAGGGCLDTTVGLVELSYGDAGVLLALPGPALAGVVLQVLGDDTQQERFCRRISDGRTWTFCAVTEPGAGNDATRMTTELTEGHGLHGVKRYIGNGSRGQTGVLFARTGKGALSIRAILLESPKTGWSAKALPMVGLRGARLSEIALTGVPVNDDMVLGGHLPPTQRGIWGAMQAFSNMRAQIAAMAVGTSLAVCDYVRTARPTWPAWERAQLDSAAAQIMAMRSLVYRTAAAVDADPDAAERAATTKLAAVRLAKQVTTRLPRLLGRSALTAHPLLEKWWRDTSAFEFMEGTSNIQRLHIARRGQLRQAGGAW